MPRIFISYRRKSWPFTHRLAEELGKRLDAEIFVDFKSIDEANFERAILHNLRESDAVLLVVSDLTFADRIHRDDDWVRREVNEALVNNKPVIMVCVDGLLPPPDLPEDIKAVARMQGINFYPEYFTPAIERLVNFIIELGIARPYPEPPRPPTPPEPTPGPDEKIISGSVTLDEALDLLEMGDFHKAIFLLEALLKAGYTPRFVDMNEVLKQARESAALVEFRRQAELAYEEIVAFARRKVTEDYARMAFKAWYCEYWALVDKLDIENLREKFSPKRPLGSRVLDILPLPFEWIEIPAGKVKLIFDDAGKKHSYLKHGTIVDVPRFFIARYPITNAQYATFIEAGGYQQEKWWTTAGWEAREQGLDWNSSKSNWEPSDMPWMEPRDWQDIKWNGVDFPVIGVSWYEAVAFCRWLSEASGEDVKLPTEQQWQRAAQGDDERIYPWGNAEPNERRGNWDDNVGQTTSVTYYPDGASPYGVLDMSGNVREWCVTAYASGSNSIEGTSERVLRGGSWYDIVHYTRCAARYRSGPHNRDSTFGFRIIISNAP